MSDDVYGESESILRAPDGSTRRAKISDLMALVDAGMITMSITPDGEFTFQVTDEARRRYEKGVR